MKGLVVGLLCLLLPAGASAATDYQTTPLTKADVDFYMDILRAAAAHNAHLTGDDKAAVDLTIRSRTHPLPTISGDKMPAPAQMKEMERNATLLARAAMLASYDEEIAKQRHADQRYDAIKNEVEQIVARSTGGAVGSCDDCGSGLTKAQIERGKKTEAALKADEPLVKPHVAEIVQMKKTIGGFMLGQ